MLKKYSAPAFVEYGTVANITGETGVSAENDWWLKVNGDAVQRGFGGSIDGCAEETINGSGRKCICTDDGTCQDHP